MVEIIVGIVAVVVGGVIGWMAASGRLQRAIAERDAAVAERARSDAATRDARRAAETAQREAAAAEARLSELDQTKELMERTFAALSQRAMVNAGELLVQMNKTQVDGSLTPLREMLDQYRGELQKSEESRNAAYGGLQEQVRSLLMAQESAQREASRLANALQSPTVRGSWGESSLKRCVELAGMSEFCDFTLQETFITDEGRRARPDLIVRLPNNRVIAVDSKAPLNDYAAASDEADELRKRDFLAAHAKTLRRHIESLSRREYQASVGETLDFTVMYLPGEHFLSAALVTDPSLFEFAVDRKIYLASPTVLLPLLRAVAAGWKAERTEENAKKMHDAGVELFNRFVKVMEHISNVGRALQSTVEKYNATIGSIDRMLWPKGEELQQMSGSGRDLGELKQIDVVPLESAKLRLTAQNEGEGEVVPMK